MLVYDMTFKKLKKSSRRLP